MSGRKRKGTIADTTPEVVVIEPLVVKLTTAAKILDCGHTKIWELCKDGKLKTIKVGSDQRITVASIRRYVEKGGG